MHGINGPSAKLFQTQPEAEDFSDIVKVFSTCVKESEKKKSRTLSAPKEEKRPSRNASQASEQDNAAVFCAESRFEDVPTHTVAVDKTKAKFEDAKEEAENLSRSDSEISRIRGWTLMQIANTQYKTAEFIWCE